MSFAYQVLKPDYLAKWRDLSILKPKQTITEANVLVRPRARYEGVGLSLNIPWVFIALVHAMECDQSFAHHLHNGDPLKARTVRVPAGRPKEGKPPFKWEVSARDALMFEELHRWTDWTIAGILYQLESFNGMGYRRYHPGVPSPYLWAGCNHERPGLYVKDGKFDKTARSSQIGAAVLLKHLALTGLFVPKE